MLHAIHSQQKGEKSNYIKFYDLVLFFNEKMYMYVIAN